MMAIKFQSVLILSLLLNNVNLISLSQSFAQTPPAETYQSGFWQPVARVDLEKPITLKLINETEIPLDYAFTEEKMEPATIEPEKTATIENIQPSVYMVVYPDSSNPDTSKLFLKYKVNVTPDNVVEVTLKLTEDGSESNRTFNLQETGAIYLY